MRLQCLIYIYRLAEVFNSFAHATGSLWLSHIFTTAEWRGVCLHMVYQSKDATDTIRAFLAHRSVHDIRSRCCTWKGPSRDNNSASVHEYFRQLPAVLISEDRARLAKEQAHLILNFVDSVINLLKRQGEMCHQVDEVLACKKKMEGGGALFSFFFAFLLND